MIERLRRRTWQGLTIIASASGADRIRIMTYLVSNAIGKALGLSGRKKEVSLGLSGFDVSFMTHSAQLGAYFDIFHRKVYEKLPEFVPQAGQVIIDAGANVGFYSLRAAKAVGPEGRVFAFEPNPLAFRFLERNMERNGLGWVECFQSALASDIRKGVLVGGDDDTSIGKVSAEGEGRSVDCVTLDSIVMSRNIARIDILKMDTEGAEPDIVRGGAGHALKITRRVVMESHNTRYPVRDLLEPHGFHMALDDRQTHTVYFER